MNAVKSEHLSGESHNHDNFEDIVFQWHNNRI